ncbi:Transcriptional regulator, GntR family [Alloactinosynnema sp. L-07]|uniref:GntR family transcriptional regulator n=1 Tax=Alloactinosynnema sp. L-07 TaxID=1653480 RepID=UPI00065EF9F8|nr:Transcriptional regulator, GntR family [Alloactinosynnema sp. L-07]
MPRLSRSLLRDEAYETLRRAIVDGTLPPGSNLRDADLAEELGLSRAPVRQALTRLAAEGLVESKPQSYTRVAQVVTDDVRDALHLVGGLHELATRAALPRMGEPQISAMREANAEFSGAINCGDVEAAIAADDRLHAVPVNACGNQALAATLDRYTPLLRRLEYARFSSLPAHHSVRRHEDLIVALEAHETEAALRITRVIWTELESLLEA